MFSKLKKPKGVLFLILLLVLVTIYINLPEFTINIKKPVEINQKIGGWDLSLFGGRFYRDLEIKKGLDLQGGVHVVLKADMNNIAPGDRRDALESVRQVIERRVNFFGVAEPQIQTSVVGDNYRVIVELPGVTDTQQAISLIGQTAQLNFREQVVLEEASEEEQESTPVTFKDTNLSGSDLKRAQVVFNPQNNQPQISIEFTDKGEKKFEKITERNVGKPLAIFLDNAIVTAPVVQETIAGGSAVISGDFNIDEAKRLAIQLNAGALPAPIEILEQKNIGATLGEESLQKSLIAGLIGLFLVGLFMIGAYGRWGILANIGLIIYGLISLSVYKLIPITLTLSGIAGFVLSIGMAVDSNILIFERLKEERRKGKSLNFALDEAFASAWDAIRDANLCILISSFVLFNPFDWGFLPVSGVVRGFALTLILGIIISLFTGVFVTKTLAQVFIKDHD